MHDDTYVCMVRSYEVLRGMIFL